MRNRSRRLYIVTVIAVCLIVFITSFTILYIYGFNEAKPQDEEGTKYPLNNEQEEEVVDSPTINNTEPHVDDNGQLQPVTLEEDTIKSSTKIIYRCYYTLEDEPKDIIVMPDYNMIGLTRDQIAKMHPEYQLVKFSSEEVVFQREIQGTDKSSKYFIKEYNGFIAIYNNDGAQVNELLPREIIETPVSSLDEEEQDKLRKGFYVDEDELLSLLQEYTS